MNKRRANKARIAAMIVILAVAAIAFAMPVLVRPGSPAPFAGFEAIVQPPSACDHILVVGRRPERLSEEDPTPHRNSRIALYQRDGNVWRKVEEDLPVRSMSTSERPPDENELRTPTSRSRDYGFVSVPTGVFSLTQATWRDGSTPAFLLSNWGRHDGTIALAETQVIRRARLVLDEAAKGTIETDVLRSSIEKRESYIHPTLTKVWSFADSNGCLNLYRPKNPEPGAKYDYDRFLDWLSSRDLHPGPASPLPLVLMDFAELAAAGGEQLPAQLPLHFYSSFLVQEPAS